MPPPKKRPAKRPKKEPNPNAVFLRPDDETAAALRAYIADQEVAPERPAVILTALRLFLADRGYLKPPPKS